MNEQFKSQGSLDFRVDIIEKEIVHGCINDISYTLPKLYEHQLENIRKIENRFKEGKGYLITDGTGTGKLQPLTEPILTSKGWELMSDIKKGSKVICPIKGVEVEVIDVYPGNDLDIYRVEFDDGTYTECCNDHLWKVQTQSNIKNKKHQIVDLNHIMNKGVVNDKNHSKFWIPLSNEVEFKEQKISLDPYFLGLMLGDGYLSEKSQCTLTSHSEIAESVYNDIIKLIPKDVSCVLDRQYGDVKARKISFSYKLRKYFEELNLSGVKSRDKFIPKNYIYNSIDVRKKVLAGLLDTDGSIQVYKNKKKCRYSTMSEKLKDDVIELIRSLGGKATATYEERDKYKGGSCWTVSFRTPFNPFYRKEKHDKFNEVSYKFHWTKAIRKVEFIRKDKGQCLLLDSEDHLYITRDYTVTHNTFVGLGLIKRFVLKGKKEILIVVPTDKKASDWIEDGALLDLYIHRLSGINDGGIEVTVTTYANFYQNELVERREFDLIVYDECHYLNQNAAGKGTSALRMHRVVSNLPSEARMKALDFLPTRPKEEDYQYYQDDYGRKKYKEDLNKWKLERVKETIRIVDSTKVLFLSATPFAYHKSIKYADGTLFDIDETIVEREFESGYNVPQGFDKFLVDNFGYTMRYGRLNKPGPEVNLDLLERNFFEECKKKNLMSTNVLELDYDYSREFATLDSDIGEELDEGMKIFHDKDTRKRYPNLAEMSKRKWGYNNVTQLIECIKARECLLRVQYHLDLGRQVVIFHTYNNSKIPHPFKFSSENLLLSSEKWMAGRLDKEIEAFNKEFSYYVNLDLSDLLNPRAAIKFAFPEAKEFNGTVNKKRRATFLDQFNDDYSDTNIVIVQTKAGREGISLHDKTGLRPRAIINLGLPTAPTQAIQEEGRIYRSGLKSDAVYEYMTLQTDFERYAFATKIAERSKTAENLAMGNLARDLERAFKDGYINSTFEFPSLNQGIGGKASDRKLLDITPFDMSMTYYFMKQKKNSKNKAKEGVDYFATPEPLGFMMCKWIVRDKEERETYVPKWLEPSAGHGAIARFFPADTKNVFIEQSSYLASQLAINANGDVKIQSFEDYHRMNKFDYILMNPPFGKSGKTAIEHLEKACKQLERSDARLLAIIPNGPAMDKRFNEFINDSIRFKNLSYTGEIILPNITFERAGTKVSCRIVRIEHNEFMPTIEHFERIDLSHITDVNNFFDEIENINFKSEM